MTSTIKSTPIVTIDRCTGRRYVVTAYTTNHHVDDVGSSLMQAAEQRIRTAEGYAVEMYGATAFVVIGDGGDVIVYPADEEPRSQ
jgi:hypothetical protein